MMTKKTPRILSGSTVLAHIPELLPQKCGFSAQRASCGHVKNTLRAVPKFFASVVTPVDRNTLFRNENVYFWL